MQDTAKCDVLVLGGGPAGSTCATRLAEKGFKVVLVEKEQHPRFHIGESLLPANMPLLKELGVADEVKEIGMLKLGIEFSSPLHNYNSLLQFGEGWNKDLSWAYQVRRSAFDEILFRNAARKGAYTLENCRVREVQFATKGQSPVRIQAETADGQTKQFEANYLVDASGRDTFLANKFKTKRKNKKHASAAVYGHFKNVQRLEGDMEGYISIFWFDHGWFWFIPLVDGTTSIGAVCWPYYLSSRKKPVEEFLMDTIALCPKLVDRMKNAVLCGEPTATGNYSYNSSISHGQQFLMVGDAYAFIDPVFSSGVLMAMNGAFVAADVIDAILKKSAGATAALANYDKVMKHGPREFSWFIHRITNPFIREMFMAPANYFRTKEAVLGVLAGDIFKNKTIWPSLYAFKAIYYFMSLVNIKVAWAAMKRRAFNIQDTNPEQM